MSVESLYITAPMITLIERIDKPTVPEVLPFVQDLYKENCAGCCLRVQLDDGNCEDRFFKEEEEESTRHPYCRALFKILKRMSVTQRLKIARSKHNVPKIQVDPETMDAIFNSET